MKIIDLTQTIEAGMEVYDGDPEVKIKEIHTLKNKGWRLKRLSLGSHTGSHVDAPYHMKVDGAKLDELPLDKFFGDATMTDIADEFPKHVGLVFRTGNLAEDILPKFVVAETPFVVVGDKATLDIPLERALLQSGILTFTGLINLNELPNDKHFAFYGIPLKIKDGDGSPIRAFAIVD